MNDQHAMARLCWAQPAKYAAVLLTVCIGAATAAAQQTVASLPNDPLPAMSAPALIFPLSGWFSTGAECEFQTHSQKQEAGVDETEAD